MFNFASLCASACALTLCAASLAVTIPMTGLQAWYKADAITAAHLADDGTTVEKWIDSSSSGFDLENKGGTPTLVPNALNGHAVVRFSYADGVGDYLDNDDLPLGTTAQTIFTVTKAPADRLEMSDNNIPIGGGEKPDSAPDISAVWMRDGTLRMYRAGQPSGTFPVIPADTYILTYSVLDTTNYVGIDGNTPVAIGSASGSRTGTRIGGNAAYAAGSFTGDLAEIIFYNRVLSATEIQTVNTYIAQKYGLDIANQLLPEPNAAIALSVGVIALAGQRRRRR